MIIVNLFGQPCAGKSVARAQVFSILKKAGVICEEVPEKAKNFTWQKRYLSLACQPYIFGKQLHEIEVLRDQVDVVITDSPILLSRYYTMVHGNTYPQSFLDSIADIAAGMDSMDYFLRRVHPYQQAGRSQSEEESDRVGMGLQIMLDQLNVNYTALDSDDDAPVRIANEVMERLRKEA